MSNEKESNPLSGSTIHTTTPGHFSTARAGAQDTRLSIEARGVLWYLLSKPRDWKVIIKDLQKQCGIGRNKVYRILNELRVAGYIIRDDQYKTADGQFSKSAYHVYDTPQKNQPCTQNGDTENGDTLHTKDTTEKDSPIPKGIVSAPAETEPENETPPEPTTVKETDQPPTKEKKWSLKDHVEKMWGDKHKGIAGALLAQMLGITKRNGKRKEYNFEEPLQSAAELWGFRYFWRDAYPGIGLPTAAETLFERFQEYRGNAEYGLHISLGQSAVDMLTGTPSTPSTPPESPPPIDDEPANDDEKYDYSEAIAAEIQRVAEKLSA